MVRDPARPTRSAAVTRSCPSSASVKLTCTWAEPTGPGVRPASSKRPRTWREEADTPMTSMATWGVKVGGRYDEWERGVDGVG